MILDFATLTGAARVALGPDFPALMASGEFESLVQQLYEPLWWQEQAGRNGEKK